MLSVRRRRQLNNDGRATVATAPRPATSVKLCDLCVSVLIVFAAGC
jgi:hypothetical protein